MSCIYLDYNATTPIDPAVAESSLPFLQPGFSGLFGNPSSSHAAGKPAAHAVKAARSKVARLLRADASEITFCGCASESVNTVIKGLAFEWSKSHPQSSAELPKSSQPIGHIITTAAEHVVVLEACKWARELGVKVSILPVSSDGRVVIRDVHALLPTSSAESVPTLLSIMLANNETGAINDIKAIAMAAKVIDPGILLHTDASQAVGKIPIDVNLLGVDYLTVAGHKLYAPKGIGATWTRGKPMTVSTASGPATAAVPSLPTLLHGASQEAGKRAGTENVPYIVALGAAAEACTHSDAPVPSNSSTTNDTGAGNGLEVEARRIASLRDSLAKQLLSEGRKAGIDVVFHGPLAACIEGWPATVGPEHYQAGAWTCLPNTLSVAFNGAFSTDMIKQLSETVACSAGAACHADHSDDMAHASVSHVLQAMGVPRHLALATLRLSLGRFSTQAEVDAAVPLIIAAAKASIQKRRTGVEVAPAASVGAQPVALTAAASTHPPATAATPPAATHPAPPPPPPTGPRLFTLPLFLQDSYRFECEASITSVLSVTSKGATPLAGRALAVAEYQLEQLGNSTSEAAANAAPADAAAAASSVVLGPAIVPPTPAAVAAAALAPVTHALVLDSTIAHAQGGGQPSDRGVILVIPRALVPADDEEEEEQRQHHLSSGSELRPAAQEPLLFCFNAVRWGSVPDVSSECVLHYGRFYRLPSSTSIEELMENQSILASLADEIGEFQLPIGASTADGNVVGDTGAPATAAAATASETQAASSSFSRSLVPVPASDVTEAFLASLLFSSLAHVRISEQHRRISARLHSAGHLLDLAVRRVYPTLWPAAAAPAPTSDPAATQATSSEEPTAPASPAATAAATPGAKGKPSKGKAAAGGKAGAAGEALPAYAPLQPGKGYHFPG